MLPRSRPGLLFAHMTLLCAVLAATAQQPPEFPLRVRETVPVTGDTGPGFIHPIKCDTKGNFYVRFGDPLGRHMSTPVTKISPEGRVETAFRLEAAPGLDADTTFDDFAVDARGRVYLLTERFTKEKEFEKLILAYDSEGKFSTSILLETFFAVGQLAVFSTGELLATGEKLECKGGECESTGRVFTGVFDRQGRLVQEIQLPDDIGGNQEEAKPSPPKEDEDQTPPTPEARSEPAGGTSKLSSEAFSRALDLGNAVAADDGNVYVMRATANPLIYAIAPNASVVRRWVIAAPSEHAGASTLQVAGGRLVVMFIERYPTGKFKRDVFVVANLETGDTIANYVGTPGSSATGCYTPDGFLLFGWEKDRLVIRRTYPY